MSEVIAISGRGGGTVATGEGSKCVSVDKNRSQSSIRLRSMDYGHLGKAQSVQLSKTNRSQGGEAEAVAISAATVDLTE